MLAIALLGCGDPPPMVLKFKISQVPGYQCLTDTPPVEPAKTCAGVPMLCDGTLEVRIFPPSDPKTPYLSTCKPMTGRKDACAIAGVDLPPPVVAMPAERLEIQMVVYPTDALPSDGDGNPICPPPPDFALDGYPVVKQTCSDHSSKDPNDPAFCWPAPAIGGSAFYNPGDTETVIELGCTDLDELRAASCSGAVTTNITANVIDFNTLAVVSSLTQDLAVSVGEPVPSGSEFRLSNSDTRPLPVVSAAEATWGGDVDLQFMSSACLEVLEDNAQSTATLRCLSVAPAVPSITFTGGSSGVRLSKATLFDVLNALGEPTFPNGGLVVGLAIDQNGKPIAGRPITTDHDADCMMATGTNIPCVDNYLSADLMHIVAGGKTSTSGVFVSTQAPYGTTFTLGGTNPPVNGFGGLVDGKVTIVILQASQPSQ